MRSSRTISEEKESQDTLECHERVMRKSHAKSSWTTLECTREGHGTSEGEMASYNDSCPTYE